MRMLLCTALCVGMTLPVSAQTIPETDAPVRSTIGFVGSWFWCSPSGPFPAVRVGESVRAAPGSDASRAEVSSGGEFALAMQYHPWRWGGLWGEIGYRAVSFSYGGDSVSGPTWLGVNYTTLGGGVEAATDLGVGRSGPGLVRLFGNVGIRIGSAGANRLETFRYRDTADGGEPVVASFGAGARSEDSPLAGVWWLGFGAGATVALGGRLGLRMDAAYELGLVDIFRDLGPDVQAPRPNLFALRIGIVALYGDAPGE